MRLDRDEMVPLALYPAFCPWRKIALTELDRIGRASKITVQSTDAAGILSAVEAGLAITIVAASALPPTLKELGTAEALPPLPDFEFVLRRSRTVSPAADHLAEMIISFYQLSNALKPEDPSTNEQSARRRHVDS